MSNSMPDDKAVRNGKRFAQDLRQAREEAGLTLGDIHEETKIPMGLLESFEEWTLTHVPREVNERADTLANEALDDE